MEAGCCDRLPPQTAQERRWPLGSSAELVAAAGLLLALEDKALLRRLRRDGLILLVVNAEIRLKDVHGLLVHVLVLVRLHLLELVETLRLVHESRVRVLPVIARRLQLARLEHILDALERHGDQPRVIASEQIAERLDAALRDQILDLLGGTARRGVGDGPRSLLLDVELGRGEQVHERRNDVGLDDGLDLLARSRGDVGDGPARLLADAFLRAVEQRKQARQRAAIEHALRLVVIAGDNVARSAQRRRLHGRRRVPHQGNHARTNASVEHCLDLLVRSVGEVAQRPAGVSEHLVVVREDQLRKHGQRRRHHRPRGLRLSAAQIGERPRRVAQH
mmetsp:Transcript_19440/g.39610  ORF Transcript_19440/g.39610 Transcript_19440/m.39610 type:complete len:334 (+) Transcript_19440:314-1315(+)